MGVKEIHSHLKPPWTVKYIQPQSSWRLVIQETHKADSDRYVRKPRNPPPVDSKV